jgi:ribosome maturation factor RimP
MRSEALINKLGNLVRPLVEENNYELYHIEMVKEGGENYLRVYIDNEEGICLDDCVKVNKIVSNLLDIEDPIPESYYLEISSPGIERKLYNEKHFQKYLGSKVVIKLNSLLDGKKKYEGILKEYTEELINIECEDSVISIPRGKISSIRLKGEY